MIPLVINLIVTVLDMFGISFPAEIVQEHMLKLVEALFAVLAMVGLSVDPTTKGLSDSPQAMNYKELG